MQEKIDCGPDSLHSSLACVISFTPGSTLRQELRRRRRLNSGSAQHPSFSACLLGNHTSSIRVLRLAVKMRLFEKRLLTGPLKNAIMDTE